MSQFGQSLFGGTTWIFWVLSPIAFVCALLFSLVAYGGLRAGDWVAGGVGLVLTISCVLLILALWGRAWPGRGGDFVGSWLWPIWFTWSMNGAGIANRFPTIAVEGALIPSMPPWAFLSSGCLVRSTPSWAGLAGGRSRRWRLWRAMRRMMKTGLMMKSWRHQKRRGETKRDVLGVSGVRELCS